MKIYKHILTNILCKTSLKKAAELKKKKFHISDETIEQIGISLIKKRLEKYGLNADEFCQQLKKYNCIITGSFPLQCILEEEWKNSDIDIFGWYEDYDFIDEVKILHQYTNEKYPSTYDKSPHNDKSGLCRCRNDKCNKKQYALPCNDHYVHKFEQYLWTLFTAKNQIKKNNTPVASNYKYIGIKEIRNYNLPNYNIQFTTMDQDNFNKENVRIHHLYDDENYDQNDIKNNIKNIVETFDFNFCKIIFDGERLYFPIQWDILIEKNGVWVNNHIIDNIIPERSFEYNIKSCTDGLAYGVDRVNTYSVQTELMKYYYDVLQRNRIKKYESRGFHIQNKLEYEQFIEDHFSKKTEK